VGQLAHSLIQSSALETTRPRFLAPPRAALSEPCNLSHPTLDFFLQEEEWIVCSSCKGWLTEEVDD
jgi:hypothetical protein